jgi:hypothetical protein
MRRRHDGADRPEAAKSVIGKVVSSEDATAKEIRAVLMLMTIAFLPLAALAAVYVAPALKPAKRRSSIFIVGGSFMAVFGAMGGYALRPALQSGYVHFNSRYAGDIRAVLAQDPWQYWAIVLVLYAMFVLLTGFGLATIGLCFRKETSDGS